MLSVYLVLLAALVVATAVTADYQISNCYLYHGIGLVELLGVFGLYRSLGLKKAWDWFFLVVLGAYLADSFYLIGNRVEEINSVGQAFCMLFILVLGLNFIWKLYQEEKIEYLGRFPYFYINAGFTLFASGAFFGYLLIARISDESIPDENFYYSWLIISGFAYIKFILISIGIFVGRKYAK